MNIFIKKIFYLFLILPSFIIFSIILNSCDISPADEPTAIPTNTPAVIPTNTPVAIPTNAPTNAPTAIPTSVPINIQFAGYNWIKSAKFDGPGGNTFLKENVYKDSEGYLHLMINNNGCAEVYNDQHLGYGRYTVDISADFDLFSSSLVFGAFSYLSDENELDLEIGRAVGTGNGPGNGQFVNQPVCPDTIHRFSFNNAQNLRFIMNWQQDQVEYWLYKINDNGDIEQLIENWWFIGDIDLTGERKIPLESTENFHLNFFIFNHNEIIYDGIVYTEVVVKNFIFEDTAANVCSQKLGQDADISVALTPTDIPDEHYINGNVTGIDINNYKNHYIIIYGHINNDKDYRFYFDSDENVPYKSVYSINSSGNFYSRSRYFDLLLVNIFYLPTNEVVLTKSFTRSDLGL